MFDMYLRGGWDASQLPVKRSVELQMPGIFDTKLEPLQHRESMQILVQIISPNSYFLILKLGEFSWGLQKWLSSLIKLDTSFQILFEVGL